MRGIHPPKAVARDARAYDPVVLWCRASKLPEPELEVMFHESRKWRFDWAWRSEKLALEQEGAVFQTGRHTRGAGFREDCLKYAEAALLGWTVLRATPDQIQDGTAFGWLTRFFESRTRTDEPRPADQINGDGLSRDLSGRLHARAR